MPANNFKNIHYLIVIISIFGLSFALISQHFAGMRPCAWCVFQRLILILIGLASLAASLVSAKQVLAKVINVVAAALAAGGILSAWYQYSVASLQFSCAQTFADKFIVASGLDALMPWLFGIYATCMDARINLLGIEYAVWSGLLFVVLLILNLFAVRFKNTTL